MDNAVKFSLLDKISAARIIEKAARQQYAESGIRDDGLLFAGWQAARERLTALLTELNC